MFIIKCQPSSQTFSRFARALFLFIFLTETPPCVTLCSCSDGSTVGSSSRHLPIPCVANLFYNIHSNYHHVLQTTPNCIEQPFQPPFPSYMSVIVAYFLPFLRTTTGKKKTLFSATHIIYIWIKHI